MIFNRRKALVQLGGNEELTEESPFQKCAHEIHWKNSSISRFPKIGQEPKKVWIYKLFLQTSQVGVQRFLVVDKSDSSSSPLTAHPDPPYSKEALPVFTFKR